MGYLDGTTEEPSKIVEVVKDNKKQAVPNTEHDAWLAKDQQLLGYLLNSLHKDVLAQVVEVTTSAELWSALQRMFSARSLAQVTNLRVQLANLKKGNMSTPDYFAKMKAIKDELAVAGKGVSDEELVSYIVNGLGYDYNPFVSSVLGRSEPTSLSDLIHDSRCFRKMGSTNLQQMQQHVAVEDTVAAATTTIVGAGVLVVAMAAAATTIAMPVHQNKEVASQAPSHFARSARSQTMKPQSAGTGMMKTINQRVHVRLHQAMELIQTGTPTVDQLITSRVS